MTELERIAAETRELFDIVDLDPLPQSEAARRALDHWRRLRGSEILPEIGEVDPEDVAGYSGYLFVYEALEDGARDYRLVACGDRIAAIVGETAAGMLLSAGDSEPYARRAHHLFDLALSRGEPVSGRFGAVFGEAGELHVEILACPLGGGGSTPGVFGAIAFRHPSQSWEDLPAGPA